MSKFKSIELIKGATVLIFMCFLAFNCASTADKNGKLNMAIKSGESSSPPLQKEPPQPKKSFLYYEDFSNCTEAKLPTTWIGGSTLTTVKQGNKIVLCPKMPNSTWHDFLIPEIPFSSDFRINITLDHYFQARVPGYNINTFIFDIGDITLILKPNCQSTSYQAPFYETFEGFVAKTPFKITGRQMTVEQLRSPSSLKVEIIKSGELIKLMVNDTQLQVARIGPNIECNSLHCFFATKENDNRKQFEIKTISVEALGANDTTTIQKKPEYFYQQNFSAVQEGFIPENWLGGIGLGVVPSTKFPERKVLKEMTEEDEKSFTIPDILFPENFTVNMVLIDHRLSRCQHYGKFTLLIGNLKVDFTNDCLLTKITLDESSIEIPFNDGNGNLLDNYPQLNGEEPFLLSLVKNGPVFKLSINDRQYLVIRKPDFNGANAFEFQKKGKMRISIYELNFVKL